MTLLQYPQLESLDRLVLVIACASFYVISPSIEGLFHFAVFHQQVLNVRFTLDAGASHRRINESLLALALVEPTQYTTKLASRPETWRH